MVRPLLAALAFSVAFAAAGAQDDAQEAPAASLLVVIDLSSAEPTVLAARRVRKPIPADEPQQQGWEVRVEDEEGRVLHRSRVQAAGVLRGERLVDGRIEAIVVADPQAAIAVRLPVLAAGAVIRIVDVDAALPGAALGADDAGGLEIAHVPYPAVPP